MDKMDSSCASSSRNMTLCLKRAYPFGSCYEPLRKAHLSDKENMLLRDPVLTAAIQQNTVRRLFAANNSKTPNINIPSDQSNTTKQRRVSFADNASSARPLEPARARRYSLSSPPPPSVNSCASCLDLQPALVCRCALCQGQVCSRCRGVCGRCARETCQNCAYRTAEQEEEVTCADCNSLME